MTIERFSGRKYSTMMEVYDTSDHVQRRLVLRARTSTRLGFSLGVWQRSRQLLAREPRVIEYGATTVPGTPANGRGNYVEAGKGEQATAPSIITELDIEKEISKRPISLHKGSSATKSISLGPSAVAMLAHKVTNSDHIFKL